MNKTAWGVFWLTALLIVHHGSCFLCYHCHQTTKRCNDGDLDVIHQKNCSEEERCAVMKYETPMPGKKVIATIRDCAKYTMHEMIRMVTTHPGRPPRVVSFQECDEPLCNLSSRIFSTSMLLCCILVLVLLLFR